MLPSQLGPLAVSFQTKWMEEGTFGLLPLSTAFCGTVIALPLHCCDSATQREESILDRKKACPLQNFIKELRSCMCVSVCVCIKRKHQKKKKKTAVMFTTIEHLQVLCYQAFALFTAKAYLKKKRSCREKTNKDRLLVRGNFDLVETCLSISMLWWSISYQHHGEGTSFGI